MKNGFIIAIIGSILIHITIIIFFAFLGINLNKIEVKEEFREVSLVYDTEFPKLIQKDLTSLAQKQQFKPKKLETIREGKKKTSKKIIENKQEKKINLPEIKSLTVKQEDKQIEQEKTVVADKKDQLAKELVTNNPPSKNLDEVKEHIGGDMGNTGADIRPSENVVLFGPIVNRNIIYSEIPEYPLWAKQKGLETEIRMKFWVSPEGAVYNISILQKSGDIRLDLLAKKSLSRWKFTPLDADIPQIKQWGEIVVRFILY